MSELEGITERIGDVVNETTDSHRAGGQTPAWHRHVALTTLIMALLAALGGLLAGITADEALLARTKEIIEMNNLNSDRLYVETLKSKHGILIALGETPEPVEVQTVAAFEEDVRELGSEAAREERLVLGASSTHMIFATAVTLLSVGITLGGMAVVVERKWLWAVGLGFGAFGAVGMGLAGVKMLLS